MSLSELSTCCEWWNLHQGRLQVLPEVIEDFFDRWKVAEEPASEAIYSGNCMLQVWHMHVHVLHVGKGRSEDVHTAGATPMYSRQYL